MRWERFGVFRSKVLCAAFFQESGWGLGQSPKKKRLLFDFQIQIKQTKVKI